MSRRMDHSSERSAYKVTSIRWPLTYFHVSELANYSCVLRVTPANSTISKRSKSVAQLYGPILAERLLRCLEYDVENTRCTTMLVQLG